MFGKILVRTYMNTRQYAVRRPSKREDFLMILAILAGIRPQR